ncbi:type III secretion system inner membrane ring subunit SctD [uncultured Thiothrix sp.]|uniref:type III secretion system inner membrane ring subunit SctD n=1 Tax=uncultured Thiothrix sp. TaxID=223185 RepID=UPI00260B0C4C|nr:type III secretion system inner membrane ring subunit SctD [uncultured Thiothrix sp.]HMT92193.1 type III secretion system inner membrane ring subunit SctD [Thiolinea sp.]
MSMQHTPYLLKVLSGSNAGALVRLKTGDTVIGKSMSSDIILHDENIADSHIKLRVEEEAINLEVLAKPLLIDNKEIDLGSHPLKPYQVVSLGSIDFFVADVRKPGRRGAETRPSESVVPPTVRATKPTENIPPVANLRSEPMELKPKSKALGWSLLLVGLGLLLLANLLFLKPYLSGLAEKVGLSESAEQRAQELLKKLQPTDLTLVRDPDGRTAISGYVQTRDDKRKLMNQALLAGSGINYRVWVREDLVANATQVARALGQNDLSFSNLEQGKLAAHGYVSDEADWAQIKANIMSDVSGIQSIDDRSVQTLIKRKEALVQFIEKKGLSSRVKVTIEKARIKVDGELTQNELKRWATLYDEFTQTNGTGPTIVENLYNVRDRLKLVIRSVSVGDTPFLVSKDGKKYMEGSSLGNDYFIKKITPDHVLLSNNGIEIPMYYGVEDK